MSWNVDTQVGYGSISSAIYGEMAPFYGPGLNEFRTSLLSVGFPVLSGSAAEQRYDTTMLTRVGWPPGTPQPTGYLFDSGTNPYSDTIPDYIRGVHPSFLENLNLNHTAQITTALGNIGGVNWQKADYLAIAYYNGIAPIAINSNCYYYGVNNGAPDGSDDAGHILRWNPRIVMPGDTIHLGFAYGAGHSYPFPPVTFPFIPVTHITTNIPATVHVGISLSFTDTVFPRSATHQARIWSVVDTGTTGATITGNRFHATAAGTAVIRATIENGTAIDTNYTQDFSITVSQLFCGGIGTYSDPFQICTPQDLKNLADYVNAGNGSDTYGAYFKLMNDVDLSEYADSAGWEPIGRYSTPFFGVFNGNDKVVQNLTINRPTEDYIGLFGYISASYIYNIGVENCNIIGRGYVGGLVGNGSVSNSYATGNVTGNNYVGGLVGYGYGYVSNNYATGNVTGNDYVGGLVGYGSVSNSYATGNVTGNNYVGGLVGRNSGIVRNCVAANSSVIATSDDTSNINRICGTPLSYDPFPNNYALNTMIVQNAAGDIVITDTLPQEGTSMPLDTLQSFDFYNTAENWFDGAWNIADPDGIWKICDGEGLPFLRWQEVLCALPTPPPAPTLNYATSTSITLNEMENCEFRMDGGAWQVSVHFTGLTPNTTYRFEARKMETITYSASEPSEAAEFATEPLGIMENELENIRIYPNPTTGELTIENGELKIENVDILDVLGRKQKIIFNFQFSTFNLIDISHLSAGVYFVKISTEIGDVVRKVVKE